jgi:hypothetical protein
MVLHVDTTSQNNENNEILVSSVIEEKFSELGVIMFDISKISSKTL